MQLRFTGAHEESRRRLHIGWGALGRLELFRADGWTVPREVLETELAAAGWPCSEAVLAAEETAGGLGHPPGGVFGVHASLRYLRGEVPWERDDLLDDGLFPDPRAPGQKLLPLWILGHPRCWLSLDGSVYLGDDIDGPYYVTRSFEDVAHYWEVLLLLDGFIVAFMRPLGMPRFRLEAEAFAGEAIARDLGLSPFDGSCFRDGEVRVFLTGLGAAANRCGTMLATRSNPPSRRRSSRIWAALLGGAIAASAVAWAAPAQAQAKIAVVDVRRAVLETEEGLRVQASLKKLFDSRQTDLDAKQVQFQKDKDALDKEYQAGKTSKDALQKKYETLQKTAAEIQALTYDYQREMSRKESELTTPILNKILGILKRIAATDGYDMIVDKSVVPYYRSDLELTDRAIQMFNAGSSDAGAKPATPDPKAPAKPGSTAPAPAPTTPAPKPAQPAPAPAPAPKK